MAGFRSYAASMAETTKRHPFFTFILLLGLLALAIRLLYGGRGKDFPDRSGEPRLTGEAIEQVAALDEPPGNIAVSANGRIFFTFHPEARPESTKLAELIDGKPVPYPVSGPVRQTSWEHGSVSRDGSG